MYGEETAVEIKVLAKQDKAIKQTMREIGLARNTVRKYARDRALAVYGPREP